MKIEDGYYSAGPIEFVRSIPIRQEIETLSSDQPVKGWTVLECYSINGYKYFKLLSAYLKRKGLSSEDELSEEEIEKLYNKCKF